jgi:hypothetical protein
VGREKRQTGSALIDIDEIDSAMTSLVRFWCARARSL